MKREINYYGLFCFLPCFKSIRSLFQPKHDFLYWNFNQKKKKKTQCSNVLCILPCFAGRRDPGDRRPRDLPWLGGRPHLPRSGRRRMSPSRALRSSCVICRRSRRSERRERLAGISSALLTNLDFSFWNCLVFVFGDCLVGWYRFSTCFHLEICNLRPSSLVSSLWRWHGWLHQGLFVQRLQVGHLSKSLCA